MIDIRKLGARPLLEVHNHYEGQGIYFITSGANPITYIGQTKNIGMRVGQHIPGIINFTAASQVWFIDLPEATTRHDREDLERALIAAYQPSYNCNPPEFSEKHFRLILDFQRARKKELEKISLS